MDDCLKTASIEKSAGDNPIVSGENIHPIIYGEPILKKSLFVAFSTDCDAPITKRKFTTWVRKYCKNKQITLKEPRSNSIDYFTFTPLP
jgi:hypothetical protein